MNFLTSFISQHKTTVVMATGVMTYVQWKDYNRYRHVAKAFQVGRIGNIANSSGKRVTSLLDGKVRRFSNDVAKKHEEMFERRAVENSLHEALSAEFTNRYYVIKGEVGTGKSRLLKELTRRAMDDVRASRRLGAPVYILAGQGSSFADNLASCVGFEFDEHVTITFLISCALQIQQLPEKTPLAKLQRTLEAIEKACKYNRDRYGFASVLVIDGADVLPDDVIKEIQRKAKIWADSNFCKVVFVTCEERVTNVLLQNTSYWSRAADPICIGDLCETEAKALLQRASSDDVSCGPATCMDDAQAQKVYDIVGGRLNHLLTCKADFNRNVPLHVTVEKLMSKERGKFVRISHQPEMWKVIEIVKDHRNKTLLLSELVRMTSQDTVNQLAEQDIIRFESGKHGVMVKFQSPLLARTIDVFYDEANA